MSAALLKTWVEIDKSAIRRNAHLFRKIIGSKVKLWSVVKSNAYGHGLVDFSCAVAPYVDGFCVDSVPEGLALREAGIKKIILVLGPTLPRWLKEARDANITLSASTQDELHAIGRMKNPPKFHLKIDTGMHRRGFYIEEMPKVVRLLKARGGRTGTCMTGVFTHFASAKDVNYLTYTETQHAKLERVISALKRAGYKDVLTHCAATGGTLIGKKYHRDAVRVGIGLYGLWPSQELEVQLSRRIKLHPVLSWRAIVSEVKDAKQGEYVGYDMAARLLQNTRLAIIPIGYWHGFPRSLSDIGEVLIAGRVAPVVGRVSMDIIVVDATGIPVRSGSVATLIGRSGAKELTAHYAAKKAGTIHYELLTRLNPLMERRMK